ncbi:MAG TPA: serine/threonine-protein kinase, partial [Thermoanaerobaculia bacterium]|nr:serine/threonine-protein kinase [Thermoanaerobaculia bacterium]
MTAAYQPGDVLGRYEIERLVGSGAMGEVYLARDPQIDRALAVKTLRLVGVPEGEVEERQQRMLREARTAGKLIHPNIVTLFDAGEQDGVLFLAFEFVAGSDLSVRLKQGPLSIGDALRYARQACEGLGHAHRQGIVHRDVKPSNLMLDADGRVKISDFGIAKLSGEATTELTMTGMVMGSPHYMAPEQVRGEELDGRSDLFSLGIVLYEMVCGQRPFEGETISTLIYQILGAEPPPLPPLRSGLVPALPDLLGRMLAKDRDARYPDAASAAAAIRAVEASLTPELARMPATRVAAPTDATVVMESGDQPSAGTVLPATVTPAMGTPATAPAVPPGSTVPASTSVPPPPTGVGPASGGSYAVPALPAAPARQRTWLLVGAAVGALVIAGVVGFFFLRGFLAGPADGAGEEGEAETVAELGAGDEALDGDGLGDGGLGDDGLGGEADEPPAVDRRAPAGSGGARPGTTTPPAGNTPPPAESRAVDQQPPPTAAGERGSGSGTPANAAPANTAPANTAPAPTPSRADAEPPVRTVRDEPDSQPTRVQRGDSRPARTPDAT